jgi:putative ABC transport system permease protein
MSSVWGHVRFAFRSFRRNPGFAIATVLVLGIGVGAVSLMFSTFNTVVLQPLPFAEPDRLVWVWSLAPGGRPNSTSYLDYQDYRAGTSAFESLAAFMLFTDRRILTGGDAAEQVSAFYVSANLFSTLGVSPQLGRGFRADEEESGQDRVAVLSHAFWQRRYGGDPGVVGSRVTLDGQTVEIVGVMPAGYDFPAGADVWLPLQRSAGYASGRGNNNFFVVGRLRQGVSLRQAQAQLEVVARNLADAYPGMKDGWGVRAVSLHDRFFGSARAALLTLMAIVALVPLVAAANVASLFLARSLSRRPELATRLALGASRAALVRQLVVESLVIAVLGGALGLALAYEGGEALRVMAPATLPRLDSIRVDGNVVAFTMVASLLLVPLFGIVPAIRGTDIGIADALKVGGARGAGGHRTGFRNGLVVAQVALSVTLLLASGLLVRSFLKLQRVDLGFRAENLLTFRAQLPAFKYRTRAEAQQVWDGMLRRLEALPGVRAVGAVDWLPFVSRGPWNEVWAEGHAPASAADAQGATRRFVSDGFFSAMGIPLLAGRTFEVTDGPDRPPVTVINETLARQFFPAEDPIGKTLVLDWSPPVKLSVVGMAGDVNELGAGTALAPTFYLPARAMTPTDMSVLVRTTADPLSAVGSVRRTVNAVDGDIPLSSVRTMEERVSTTLAQPRFRSAMVMLFALVSLILSAIGLYGVLAYFVRQRSREIGVRLALGAGQGAVRRLVILRGMALVGAGSAIGVVGGFAAARVIRGQNWLYGIGAVDPLTVGGVICSLGAVALVACLVPAIRAARLDPAEVMRAE